MTPPVPFTTDALTRRLAPLGFALSLAGNLLFAARDPSWWMLPALFAGWYAADLASGVAHMVMDYRPVRAGVGLREIYFYEGDRTSAEYLALRDAAMARIGPYERLVYDFKNHHPRPEALGRRSMAVQVRSIILPITLPVSLALNLACWRAGVPGWLVVGLVAGLVGGTFAQYFHGTLHRDDNPPAVRAMRRLRLLCTPQYHAKHHATLTCDFATINGWSNPLLNRVFDALRRRGVLTDAGLEPQG